jgi:hypothetical protein
MQYFTYFKHRLKITIKTTNTELQALNKDALSLKKIKKVTKVNW